MPQISPTAAELTKLPTNATTKDNLVTTSTDFVVEAIACAFFYLASCLGMTADTLVFYGTINRFLLSALNSAGSRTVTTRTSRLFFVSLEMKSGNLN